MELKVIATIHNDFISKFGIPRQSGLVENESLIFFEPEYRNPDALRGIEEYSYLWLLWGFSEVHQEGWSPMVRPPRLGGNTRKGVFATRSPYRPNPIGLSSVRLLGVEELEGYGYVLRVEGADLLSGTPIYDIKPYLPHVDVHQDAAGGFAAKVKDYALHVVIPPKLLSEIPKEKQEIISKLLAQDPRPSYQEDPDRVYGMEYADMDIRFQVEGDTLTVREILQIK